jgi:methyltransferase (TIGR00027 family)
MSRQQQENSQSGISVADTAHWIADLRARESARPDALFHDPLAARFGGAPSQRAPASVPAWPLIARTKLIDDLVHTALAEGADRVVNLAAGLDTRPYRLRVPAGLRWVEADLPQNVEYKQRELASVPAACELVREAVDLSDQRHRRAFLARASQGAKRALVITEGLLMYLEPAFVEALTRDLAARPEVKWWVVDLASPATLELMQAATDRHLTASSRMRFAPEQGVAFFRPLGFRANEVQSMLRAATRWKRAPLMLRLTSLFPEPNPERLGRRQWSAVVRFERIGSQD